MNISHFCIDRPIFASVISIVITLGGAVAMLALPIAQYPDITPPQITISATYPGASADVVANNVAAPIEQQVNGADNMIYMNSSSSSTGNLTLNVFFEIGTNPELAQVDVQNRVNLALPQLPSVGAGAGRPGAEEVVGVHDGDRDLFARPTATTRPTSPTTRTSTCSMRLSAFPAPTSRASSARPTTRCASGSSPTAWRSSASPRPTCRRPSRTRTSSSRSGASASRRPARRSSSRSR